MGVNCIISNIYKIGQAQVLLKMIADHFAGTAIYY